MPGIPDPRRSRQLHLDFHTSPHIAGVAARFDPAGFADTMARARIDSVTVFARCHHGWCYYPTRVGAMHPGLGGRDLLGEQIEALHRRGIRCPVYLTVGWDEWSAALHPDWRQVDAEGRPARVRNRREDGTIEPGGWHYLNWLHPDYLALQEALMAELLERYEIDGFFFDIFTFAEGCCWSETSRRFRAAHGLEDPSHASWVKFRVLAQNQVSAQLDDFRRARAPQASLFFNTGSFCYVDSRFSIHGRMAHQSHYEIESLPTGHWGYFHFPKIARQVRQYGVPWSGQTARFQKSWGDFGGIKPAAALEFECFRTQAMGGMVGVGDQLHPDGTLDQGAYELIGDVYRQVEAAEPFYAGSSACPQIGIFLAASPGMDEKLAARSESGTVLLCEETHYDCAVLDDASDLSPYALVVLPDTTPVGPELAARLRDYQTQGGKLLFSGAAGFDPSGRWALDFLPIRRGGGTTEQPTYWRATELIGPPWTGNDRVIYRTGPAITACEGAAVVACRRDPYFERTDAVFCSHFQAPPRPGPESGPAVVLAPTWACIADPVFRDYRESGGLVIAAAWRHLVRALIGPPLAGERLSPSILCLPRRREDDLLLTLLRYVPVRKALQIDVISESMPFTGESLTFDRLIERVRVEPTGEYLARRPDGAFALAGSGRLLLTVPGFFGH